MIDLMSHGDYSLYEPREMMEENKAHFRTSSVNLLPAILQPGAVPKRG